MKTTEIMVVEVAKEHVAAGELVVLEQVIQKARFSPEAYHDKLHIVFGGYHEDPREIFEIEEVRAWVQQLVLKFPDVLFYLEAGLHGFQNIILCLAEVEYIAAATERESLLRATLDDQLIDTIYIRLYESIVHSFYPSILPDTMARLLAFTKQTIRASNQEPYEGDL